MRWHKYILIILCLMIVLSPLSVYAQSSNNSTEYASTGTLAAAGLESAGYKAQSIVLEDLAKMLTGLGALFFIGAALAAMITFVISGSYGTALWFFIGPGLLFFLIRTTDSGQGVEWQYAEKTAAASALIKEAALDPQNEQVRWLKADEKAPKVSWFFHQYNKFVSETVQQMITVISDKALMNKMKFTIRQQLYEDIITARIGSPDLNTFTQYTLAVCADELEAARILALGEKDPEYKNSPEYRRAAADYAKLYDGNAETKPLRTGPLTRYINQIQDAQANGVFTDPLAGLNLGNSAEGSNGGFGVMDRDVRNTFAEDYEALKVEKELTFMHNKASCNQLWVLMGLGLYKEGAEYLQKAVKDKVAKNNDTSKGDFLKAIMDDIAIKLQSRPNYQYDPEGGSSFEYPAEEIVIDNKKSDPKISLIPVIIGGYMLRKAQADGTHGKVITSFAEHSGVIPTSSVFDPTGATAYSEKEMWQFGNQIINHIIANRKKHELFIFAMMIPYVQGVLLYTLALAFPFVCLAVVLPGKANVFFSWCALWAWLKSWDFGWSLVMILDNILWQLMPHSGFYDPTSSYAQTPITIMEQAFFGDPGYNMANYYTLIALLVTSVPVIMARLIIGAKAAGLSAFVDNFKSVGSTMAGAVGTTESARLSSQYNNMRRNFEARTIQSMYANDVNSFQSNIPFMKDMNEKMTEARANFKSTEEESAFQRGLGMVATAGGAMINPISAWGGANATLAQNRATQDSARDATALEAQQRQRQAGMMLGEYYSNNVGVRQFEQLRAMSNGRGEPFGLVEFSPGDLMTPMMTKVRSEATTEQRKWTTNVESAVGFIK
ncbi:MAG: hypothetical protein IT292_04120 [Deltaproteobacteria bacterium]|nr:hypothetical protein [Deltaproteobacteria bacterium]